MAGLFVLRRDGDAVPDPPSLSHCFAHAAICGVGAVGNQAVAVWTLCLIAFLHLARPFTKGQAAAGALNLDLCFHEAAALPSERL